MFAVSHIRDMMAQYALGYSHGETKQPRSENRADHQDFYQEAYDDALSGRRTNLAELHCLFVGKKDPGDESFAKRQIVYAFRKAVAKGRDPQEAIRGIYSTAQAIMEDRGAFFLGSLACPLEKDAPLQAPDGAPAVPDTEQTSVQGVLSRHFGGGGEASE